MRGKGKIYSIGTKAEVSDPEKLLSDSLQDKYNMLADRLADALVSQDPNATKYMKFSGDQTHLMSGPTFLNRHPELAEKYGMTGQPMHMLVKQGKAPTLDAKPMNKIPIEEVAMELKGQRIPQRTKKQQPKATSLNKLSKKVYVEPAGMPTSLEEEMKGNPTYMEYVRTDDEMYDYAEQLVKEGKTYEEIEANPKYKELVAKSDSLYDIAGPNGGSLAGHQIIYDDEVRSIAKSMGKDYDSLSREERFKLVTDYRDKETAAEKAKIDEYNKWVDQQVQSGQATFKKGGSVKLKKKSKKDSRLVNNNLEGYNKPKRTPNHPTKSHVVLAKVGDVVKLIRFGEQGAKTAGKPKKGESIKMKKKRASFKARHAKNIKKGKLSAAYWADKVKW